MSPQLQPNAEVAPAPRIPKLQTATPPASGCPAAPKSVPIHTPRGEQDDEPASEYQQILKLHEAQLQTNSEFKSQMLQLHDMLTTFIMNKSTGTHAEQNEHLTSINEDYEEFCEIWEYEDEYKEDLLSSDLVATQHDSQASQAKAASLAGVSKVPSSVFNRTKEADYCAFESWPSVPKF